LVDARETGGAFGDHPEVLVGQIRHDEAFEYEEVEIDLDEAPGLPVEGQAVHDSKACGAGYIITCGKREIRRLVRQEDGRGNEAGAYGARVGGPAYVPEGHAGTVDLVDHRLPASSQSQFRGHVGAR